MFLLPSNPTVRRGLPLVVVLVLLTAVGCGDSAEKRLLGQWRGRPDTASARAKRKAGDEDAQRAAQGLPPKTRDDAIGISNVGAEGGDLPKMSVGNIVTDWEQFEFDVQLHFVDRRKVRISMQEQQPVEGTWQVTSNLGDQATIEIRTKVTKTQDGSAGGTERKTGGQADQDIRRFVVRFEGEKKDRFTLSEDGADPYVGSLLFHKVKK